MNTESTMPFFPDSDLHEFGLIAAALPEFPEALIRALQAAGVDGEGGPRSSDSGKDRAAA